MSKIYKVEAGDKAKSISEALELAEQDVIKVPEKYLMLHVRGETVEVEHGEEN